MVSPSLLLLPLAVDMSKITQKKRTGCLVYATKHIAGTVRGKEGGHRADNRDAAEAVRVRMCIQNGEKDMKGVGLPVVLAIVMLVTAGGG